MTKQEAEIEYALRIADSNLIAGQRFAEWCSNGPILEEDIAMTNLSLDLFGQAELIYQTISKMMNGAKNEDELAFIRHEREYKNALIVELPKGDFAYTMVKHYLYSEFLFLVYDYFRNQPNSNLKEISERAIVEIKYHISHCKMWLVRFGHGTDESKIRVQQALNDLWAYTEDLFITNETDDVLKGNIPSDIQSNWENKVKATFTESNLTIPDFYHQIKGGYNGIHTEHLGHMLGNMQYLQRAMPGANWNS